MSFINHANREIHLKLVYCGTGMSGKTTNIQWIYENTKDDRKGKLITIDSDNERTLFFDFLPLSVGEVRGLKTKFHLYSVPGQSFYDISREFIVKGLDGIVFVVDSQPSRMEANIESYESLEKMLSKNGYDIDRIPLVFQYNKRDLKDAVSLQELEATFNPGGRPHFEAIATLGQGVMETLQSISQQVVKDLKGGNYEKVSTR